MLHLQFLHKISLAAGRRTL